MSARDAEALIACFLQSGWQGEGDAKALLRMFAAAGHVVMPVEPTLAMISAGCKAHDSKANDWAAMEAAWSAMLAAASEDQR